MTDTRIPEPIKNRAARSLYHMIYPRSQWQAHPNYRELQKQDHIANIAAVFINRLLLDGEARAYLASRLAEPIRLTFQVADTDGDGPGNLLRFIDAHREDGRSVNVGTWAADGEYEELTVMAVLPEKPTGDTGGNV